MTNQFYRGQKFLSRFRLWINLKNLFKKVKGEKELDIEELPKIWDKYAKIYDKLMVTPLFKESSKIFLSSIFPCPDGMIHDGGCGSGYWIKDILEKTQAKKLIATDISPGMLEKAKEKVSKLPNEYQNKIEFRQMDLTKDWPEETFDAQIFQQLANYLPFGGWKRIIEMAYQTLYSGGYIYSSTYLEGLNIKKIAKKHTFEQMIHTPISSYPAMLRSSKILSVFDKLKEENIIRLPSRDEYLDYHKKIGFKNIEIIGEIVWGAGIVVRAKK